MNPQTNLEPGSNLPQPQTTGAATMPMPGQAVPSAVPANEPPMLAVTPPVLRPTVPVHPVEPTAQLAEPIDNFQETPAEAGDIDVIEREWVIKAKEVVAATRHDPYKQVQELNKIKADYMKKRYDKDIKLADE